MHVRAHAKLNLALAVGPATPPRGYHPICSWFVTLDLADDVYISPINQGSEFAVYWAPDAPRPSAIDWPVEKDLAFRAHLAFEAFVGHPCPVKIEVLKRIPVGGGLGGGSSDAAAVLKGLRDLYAPDMEPAKLAQIGAALGSDVAYFCDPFPGPTRPAMVEGFGEQVTRVERAGGAALLVIPPFACETAGVYRAFDALPPPTDSFEHRCARVRAIAETARREGVLTAPLFNDLTGAATAVRPELGALLRELERATGRRAFVTGSGSCVFIPALAAELFALAPRARAVSALLRECVCVESAVV